MQDRFKFRAWNKDLKRFLVHNEEDKTVSLHIFEDICNSDRYELLQCTAVRDKNGKLIYEGDIVRSDEYPYMSEGQDNYYAEICWDKESAKFFYYTFKNPKFNDVSGISTGNTGNLDEYNWEVIGNIYENPELLEDE